MVGCRIPVHLADPLRLPAPLTVHKSLQDPCPMFAGRPRAARGAGSRVPSATPVRFQTRRQVPLAKAYWADSRHLSCPWPLAGSGSSHSVQSQPQQPENSEPMGSWAARMTMSRQSQFRASQPPWRQSEQPEVPYVCVGQYSCIDTWVVQSAVKHRLCVCIAECRQPVDG